MGGSIAVMIPIAKLRIEYTATQPLKLLSICVFANDKLIALVELDHLLMTVDRVRMMQSERERFMEQLQSERDNGQ